MRWVPLLAWMLFSFPSMACKCELTLSVCNEVAHSNVVFIGTVESIEPRILDGWNPSERSTVGGLNSDYLRALEDRSPASLEKLRQAYLKTFPDLPDSGRQKIRNARTPSDFSSAFTWILDNGRTVRFRVRTLFRNVKGDDDDGDDDSNDDTVTELTIWTPFGDCGYNFQVGETYLVYALGDEESPMISTSVCSRTRRVSDAGEDLAYLFFYKNDRKRSSRLDGFVTTNELYQRDYDPKQFSPSIAQAVAGVTVELRSDGVVRYAESDSGGRFIFDGLPSGDYQTTAFGAGFPNVRSVLAGPKKLSIPAMSCSEQVLIAPKSEAHQPEK